MSIRATFPLVAAVLLSPGTRAIESPPHPHLFFLLLDDYGWANWGYHSPGSPEVVTPNLDALAASGVVLERHYVHKFCSPTRSALQTGRSPIHVNVLNSPLNQHNPGDPVSGFQGAPRNMTGIAEKLKSAGYATHMAVRARASPPRSAPRVRTRALTAVCRNAPL